MPLDKWSAVDDYINASVVRPDEALEAALRATAEAGMPPIAVSAAQGKLLAILARMIGATRVLEIGTLGAYSTIWLARALPAASAGGKLISLEIDPKHADVARKNLANAGVDAAAEVRVGPALETLPALQSEGPFDMTFIDADKVNIPAYFDWAVKLGRPGSIIVVDNVVRDGKLIDESTTDPNVEGVRRLHEALSSDGRVTATTIQTVGSKGYDGFTVALVNPAGNPAG
ncbi:MAG TPA: O-methyltransferase [Acidimicrobiales bacterium]|nr:O-methyltransferase [Acidimicrobiales bacterium]